MDYEDGSKIGVIFDAEDSAKLIELINYYETDVYNLLASAIDVMYKTWESDE